MSDLHNVIGFVVSTVGMFTAGWIFGRSSGWEQCWRDCVMPLNDKYQELKGKESYWPGHTGEAG